MTLPILYSLQNCPYAMRARLALLQAQQDVMLRAISMKNKPDAMLAISPKGTVPVLALTSLDNSEQPVVIDESLDIMLWALSQSDPSNLLINDNLGIAQQMHALIAENDHQFRPNLSSYKHAKRYHLDSLLESRQNCEVFLNKLENRLIQHAFLMGVKPSLADYAILPFIRQVSRVERQWYLQAPYPQLQHWLNKHLQSRLFAKAMTKYSVWLDTGEQHLFSMRS